MNPSHYTAISFPLLGIEVNPARTLTLGAFTIHYYGVAIALGLMLAVLYCCKRSKEFGLKEDDILDGVLWITPFSIICARIYYVIFSWETYANDLMGIFRIWEGGIAIYGGVLGAIAGMAIFCRIRKIKLSTVLDLILLGFLIGQSIGRWGNFINREAFGAATDSFLKMGLYNKYTFAWEYHHPTFLYESLWNLAGFVLLHHLSKRRQYDGQIALGYAAWYGFGRTMIEGLRMDSLYWGPFRVSQLLAAVSCLVAVVILLKQMFRDHDPALLLVNQPEPAKDEEKKEDAEEKAEEAAEEIAEEAAEEAAEDAAEDAEEAEEAAEEAEEAAEEAEEAAEEAEEAAEEAEEAAEEEHKE